MKKTNKFSPEVRERAVRMVQEQRGEYPSLWAAIESIAPKIGCVPQTLNEWVKRAEVDAGTREGVATAEAPRWPGQIPPPLATPNSPRQDRRIMTTRVRRRCVRRPP